MHKLHMYIHIYTYIYYIYTIYANIYYKHYKMLIFYLSVVSAGPVRRPVYVALFAQKVV